MDHPRAAAQDLRADTSVLKNDFGTSDRETSLLEFAIIIKVLDLIDARIIAF